MIEAISLTGGLGRRAVVRGLQFSVSAGEIVAFLGANGSGKTTTMRMLAGSSLPWSGAARICGEDVVRRRRVAQSKLGYLPEAASGFGRLTAWEFLRFCAEAHGLWRERQREAIDRVVQQTDLAPAMDTPMMRLSKGWRQRVWLAQAIVHDPAVLVLDEPTDGLDPNQKLRVRGLIRELSPGRAIILSTHILEEAEELCTRAMFLAGGGIVADAAPQELADERGRLASAFHRLTCEAQDRPGGGLD